MLFHLYYIEQTQSSSIQVVGKFSSIDENLIHFHPANLIIADCAIFRVRELVRVD